MIYYQVGRVTLDSVPGSYFHAPPAYCPDQGKDEKQDTFLLVLRMDSETRVPESNGNKAGFIEMLVGGHKDLLLQCRTEASARMRVWRVLSIKEFPEHCPKRHL